MKRTFWIISLLITLSCGCVTQFIPEISEGGYTLVIEGGITDGKDQYEVTISWSHPLNPPFLEPTLNFFIVSVYDDTGNEYHFTNAGYGRYLSDSTEFRAVAGKQYKLHVEGNYHVYESDFTQLIPVPPIDSIFADLEYNEFYYPGQITPGYQVYVNTNDPTGECRFFRWVFDETWEFRLPYTYRTIINRICWKSDVSDEVNIKSTSALIESRVSKQPVTFITTETDRLMIKYSILVKQYSLTEDEFIYWENVKETAYETGGLYEAIPSSLKNNLKCIDDPNESVLGYFSVSSVSEKRLFIENIYERFPDYYASCPFDTILVNQWDPEVHKDIYILKEWTPDPPTNAVPPLIYYVLSRKRECIDCAMNGSNEMPDYWTQPGQQKIFHSLFDEEDE